MCIVIKPVLPFLSLGMISGVLLARAKYVLVNKKFEKEFIIASYSLESLGSDL